MTALPTLAMYVSNVAASSAFLTEILGFTLLQRNPGADIAHLLDSDGDILLLVGPTARDVSSHLAAQHFIARPGESISFGSGDLEAWQAELASKGVTDTRIKQRRLGDRILALQPFDNYTFRYIEIASRPFEDLLPMYACSPDELDKALIGLSEADTRLTMDNGGWNIRQIVHHIADTDILFGEAMKIALSSPGTVVGNQQAVGNERIASEPEYRERPVASSVALFRAFHEHILDIIKYIPDAGERYIKGLDKRKQTFAQMMHSIVGHTGEHLEEIWEIRHKHGK